MLQRCYECALQLQNCLDQMYWFGYDPHINVSMEPMVDRASPMLVKRGVKPSPSKLSVPLNYVKNNCIRLNLAVRTIRDYRMDFENAVVSFRTTFAGKDTLLVIPVEHVMSVDSGPGHDVIFQLDPTAMRYTPNPAMPIATLSVTVVDETPVEKKPSVSKDNVVRPNFLRVVKNEGEE